jgi:cold shock CspA family protein
MFLLATASGVAATHASAQPCGRTIKADVVALDQAFYNNRLGAFQAGGMIFALRRDVVPIYGTGPLTAGQVMLRPSKRPRPMVLRMNVDDCLEVRFQNLLSPLPSVFNASAGNQQFPVRAAPATGYRPNQNARINQEAQTAFTDPVGQPAARMAGVHVMGLQLVSAQSPPGTTVAGSAADGSWVGANDAAAANPPLRASGLVGPGQRAVYTYVAKAEGAYLLYSTAANVGFALGFGGQLMQGLFGSVTVQPRTAEWYRSQVTRADLALATTGKTADGHPIIDYDKVYPAGHPRAGQPVLKMLNPNNEIVYSDLTAIITGPKHGRFDCANCPGGTCGGCPTLDANPSYPDRAQPYREFAIHYHDDFLATQAFSEFSTPAPPPLGDMTFTLRGGRDFFAINYGIGGIGAEVWANRIKVGPMHDCATCRFEEFFLSSWAVGDPAMVVDIPANAVDPKTGQIKIGPKATKALYPDDPSNVYHSYMGDHVKFQILHAGTNISHVHHLHAHQWLHTPNDDKSSYRDSQMLSPGGSYTLDHTYSGSGNKNKTVGDSIFHCHFYPHFAQGMWSLWRVHDVFEGGTQLDAYQRPAAGWNRALPDGEIAAGTPIPALVPMPTLPMAPIGARVRIVPLDLPGGAGRAGFRAEVDTADPNIAHGPGYPFFIPGVAGQRGPHPPLDFAPDEADAANPFLNGGLPRFLALKEVGTLYEKHNRWDFSKFNDRLKAVRLDENGTAVEKTAMAYHAKRRHDTFLPDGTPATGASGFILNGRPPINGAPFADPAVLLDGTPVCPENKPPCLMRYKAADIQLDLVFNKKGQHFPQARMTALWGDVKDTLAGTRAPEPFFFRANSTQVIEYWLANLVPNYYELDNFQVRTPTDILGQHIHLVKFDVTSSDGSGNGFNYEDGSLSPDEVREVIENINHGGGLFASFDLDPANAQQLKPKAIPYFGGGDGGKWLGAQATIQRWYADPVVSNGGVDRTLRTVFTHDHFGPSTHQQVGLYAGLLIEPDGSRWQDPVNGTFLGTNLGRPAGANGQTIDDGGPTSWQANILTADKKDSYREFAIEFQDRQLAYKSISKSPAQFVPYKRYPQVTAPCANVWGWADDATKAINPPVASGVPCSPSPSIVTLTFGTGTYSLNYRNEPPAFRVNQTAAPTSPEQTDLSHVFRSISRIDPAMNVQPTGKINPACPGTACFSFSPPQFGVEQTDPYTPMLRAYEGDKVQIRTLVGAHMSPHYFTVHGINWLFEPTQFDAADNTSGYRGTQGMGISEHYEMLFSLARTSTKNGVADYLYSSSSDAEGLANGNWGIMRAYQTKQPTPGLVALPNNEPPASAGVAPPAPAPCPAAAPVRPFNVVAVRAADVLGGPLVYNARGRAGKNGDEQIVNPEALAYFLAGDLDPINKTLLPGTPVEPLILRANAGDCITITLENRIPGTLSLNGESLTIPVSTSAQAGLHPQLVSFDVTTSNGVNVGKNPVITVAPGTTSPSPFTWYAGRVEIDAGGKPQYLPVEFGSIPLTPSDPLMQHPYGLLGALVIEPQGSSWRTDDNSRASASVCKGSDNCKTGDLLYREFVAIVQDDIVAMATASAAPAADIVILGDLVNGKPTWTMNGQPLPAAGVPLKPGQTVSFDIKAGTHGLLFATEASARAVFDVDNSPDKGKFQTFPSQCGQANSFGTTPQGSGHIALLKAKQPFTLTPLPFVCSQHCQNMPGAFTLGSGPPPPPPPIAIVGDIVSGKPTWTMNGQPLPAAGVPLQPGQTVNFDIKAGTHGLHFATEASARAVFDIDNSPDKGKFQTVANQCGQANSFGTTPQGSGHIATLTAKQPFTLTPLPFLCSLHCQNMPGAFALSSGPPPPPPVAIVGDIVSGKPTWTMNGQPLPAAGVPLQPGQTVSFDIKAGTHGVQFATEASARAVFDIDNSPDKGKFQTLPNQCGQAGAFGTKPQASGHIATLTAKQPFTLTPLPFLCSQHCQNMPGAFALAGGGPAPPNAATLTPEPAYTRAINYRTEPLDYRFQAAAWLENLGFNAPLGVSRALSNTLVLEDPQTPVFVATANTPVRFRVVHPAGLNEQVFTLHGHVWQEEPYVNGSREIGLNPRSQSQGSRDGVGPNVAFDAVIDKAGGAAGVPGDYLYRTFIGNVFQAGVWGLFRVAPPSEDVVTITRFSRPKGATGPVLIAGSATVDPGTGRMADRVTIFDTTAGAMKELGQADIDKLTGKWPKTGQPFQAPGTVRSIQVRSAGNGRAAAAAFINEPAQPTAAPPPAPAAVAAQAKARARRAMAVQEDEVALFNAVPKRRLLIEAVRGEATPTFTISHPAAFDAATRTIRVRPGETVSFAVRDARQGAGEKTYELTFPDRNLAERTFEFESPGAPFERSNNDKSLTTGQLEEPGVVATLRVRAGVASGTRVPVSGVLDGQPVTATFVIQP